MVKLSPLTKFLTVVIAGLVLVSLTLAYLLVKSQPSTVPPLPTPTPSIPLTSPTKAATPRPTPASTTQSIDAVWDLYTNNILGFSIKLPKIAAEFGGSCKNGQLDVGTVPVKTFEDQNGLYITYESFYEYPKNNLCQKTINSLAIIDQRANQWRAGTGNELFVPGNWHIITAPVKNDQELLQFIKTNYGSGCKLGDKKLNSAGDYDVRVEGDGLDLEVTKCPLNFIYALKYSPKFQKAATWGVGQSVVFSSADLKQGYDLDIINSFKFLK